MITAYCKSFFKNENSNVRLASSRAGNVIGGGDWAKHRIIPDCIRAWSSNREVEIRNSQSTRPWQHVLEPLSGYLTLAYHLDTSDRLNGESFNFGPDSNKEHSVGELVNEVAKQWVNAKWINATEESGKLYEANLLNLDCNKALEKLNWKPLLDFEETSAWTGKWYNVYYNESKESAMKVTQEQIEEYSGFLNCFNDEGIIKTKLKIINQENGSIYHVLRSTDKTFDGFEEIYFSSIKKVQQKAGHYIQK